MAQSAQLNQTLYMIRGDVREWSFAVKDENNAAISIAGATGFFTGKLNVADLDSAAVFQLTVGAGITIDAGVGGTGSVKLSAINTALVPDVRTTLFFDLQFTVSGNVYTVARGNLIIDPDVTLS